jgi:tRNA pseudouridine-54 N-methylase
MASTVPHLLLDEDGSEISEAAFAPNVVWEVGDTLVLGALQRYRVIERRDGETTIVLVVERL